MTNDELSAVASTLFNPHDGSGRRDWRAAASSVRAFSQTAPATTMRRSSSRCSKVCPTAAATSSLDSIPRRTTSTASFRLEQLLEQLVRRLELPTRYCVLSDIVKQREAQRRTRVDVGFQSLAGTSRALAGMVGLDVDGLVDVARTSTACISRPARARR